MSEQELEQFEKLYLEDWEDWDDEDIEDEDSDDLEDDVDAG
jgi:hypothetical protein